MIYDSFSGLIPERIFPGMNPVADYLDASIPVT